MRWCGDGVPVTVCRDVCMCICASKGMSVIQSEVGMCPQTHGCIYSNTNAYAPVEHKYSLMSFTFV